MPETIQNIQITATGGDAAAGEINKASNALRGVTETSKGMEEAFQHRFTHIGLQLFAGDLLHTAGLGAETRQIIGTMQTAIMGAGAAFGAAAGPVMLAGSALVAFVGIVQKVIDKRGEEAAAIQKQIDAQEKAIAPYQSEIAAINNYADAGGHLTKQMTDLLNADKAVAANIESNLLKSQQSEIEALIKQRDELGRHQQMHNAWIAVLGFAKDALLALAKAIADMIIPGISFFSGEVQKLIGHLGNLVSSVNTHIKLTGEFAKQHAELTAKIAQMQLQHSLTAQHVIGDINAMTKAQQNYRDNVDAVYREMMRTREDAAEAAKEAEDEENARELKQMDNRLAYFIANKQKEVEEHQKALDKQQAAVKKAADYIGQQFGSAFAQSIVEGKNFSQEMQKAFQQMAMKFIEHVIQMVIEWAVLKAVMNIYPGGEAAYEGMSNAAYPALSQATYAGMADDGGAFAAGGSAVVDKPTYFLAGEAGPELAVFTPLSDMGSNSSRVVSSLSTPQGGGAGSPAASTTTHVTVGDIAVNVQLASMSPGDRQTMLRQLADEIRAASVDAVRFSVTSANLAAKNPRVAV